MKKTNKSRLSNKGSNKTPKYIGIGFLIGSVFGFLIPFFITGELPFVESYSMGLGNMRELNTIFYLFFVGTGACLGIIIGFIFGIIFDYRKK